MNGLPGTAWNKLNSLIQGHHQICNKYEMVLSSRTDRIIEYPHEAYQAPAAALQDA